MTSETLEILAMWGAVTAYAVGGVLYALGALFRRDRLLDLAFWISVAGLVPHTAGIAARWMRVGHGPYIGYYEAVSSLAWSTVVLLGIIAWRWPKLRVLGIVIMPISFLAIGGAMLAPKAPIELSGTLASWWLTIHVTFAKLSYSSFIAAFVIALAYVLRERRTSGAIADLLAKLPDQARLDDLSYRWIAVGFIFLTVMVGSGAIWANEAWGRYWGWDPIETWSLISWLVYAGYLHVRLTLGWHGKKSAWYAMLALPIVVFALIGVPVVFRSIHGAYLLGY